MEGYSIRRTVKIEGNIAGIYFKNNETPPLYNLSDIARLTSLPVKALIDIASKEHCVKLQTNTSYSVWTCDFEGLCKILHETMEENRAVDIIAVLKEFTDEQYRTLPGPLTVTKKIKNIFSKKYFSLVTGIGDFAIRYVKTEDTRWFAAQDIVRCFQQRISAAEDIFDIVDDNDKCDITFKNSESRMCINETALTMILKQEKPALAEDYLKQLISKCEKLEKRFVEEKFSVDNLIVDGTAVNTSRYMISYVENNMVVFLRYDNKIVITLYSVRMTAKKLNFDINEAMAAAKQVDIAFVTEDDIFVEIESLIRIFGSERTNLQYCAFLFDKSSDIDIKQDAIKNTTADCDLVLLTREQLQERNIAQVKPKRFEPYRTTGEWFVAAYDNFEIKEGKHILLCLAKKDWNNPEEKITPLFWSTSVGLYTDCPRFNKFVNEVCDDSEYCKVTFSDIKKFNIKMITVEGIRKVLSSVETVEDPDKIINELIAAAKKFEEQSMKDIKFNLEKYNARRKGTVNEQKTEDVSQQEAIKKEIKDNSVTLQECFISFRDQELRIAVTITKEKGAVIYYDIAQLCNILNIKETDLNSFVKQKDNEGKETLISIYDITDALTGAIKNPAETVKELFKASKHAVTEVARLYGMKVKDETNTEEQTVNREELMQDLLRSNDSQHYTLGAIILAERFRELLIWIALNDKKINGVAGPSNNRLLDTLWKFIDCQAPEQTISFGFRKQTFTVMERYNKLKKMFED